LKLFQKKTHSTRELIGADSIGDHSLKTYNQGEIVFFIIKPHNLAVLSPESIMYRLHALSTIIKSVEEMEMCCQNSRESFEDNKEYLKGVIEKEPVEAVRELCEKDIAFLDKTQLSMATAREFTLSLRFRTQKPNEIQNTIHRVEKLLKEQNFDVKRAVKADIQRMLAVYFEQNITQNDFKDIDGANYADNIMEGGVGNVVVGQETGAGAADS